MNEKPLFMEPHYWCSNLIETHAFFGKWKTKGLEVAPCSPRKKAPESPTLLQGLLRILHEDRILWSLAIGTTIELLVSIFPCYYYIMILGSVIFIINYQIELLYCYHYIMILGLFIINYQIELLYCYHYIMILGLFIINYQIYYIDIIQCYCTFSLHFCWCSDDQWAQSLCSKSACY